MALKIKDLRIYYQTLRGDVKAVDGISFQVKDGEIMGLAGESGCGKSTLSNALILLKPPMKYISGEVFLNDKKLPIDNYEAMRANRFRGVSIIPQDAMNALNPIRKLKQIISDLLEHHRENFVKMRDIIEERLKLVELDEKVLDLYPIELSGGMNQRMVMVISTLLNPSLLLADEITSALDVSSQKAVSKMIVEFRDRKIVRSVIFVTHDISILYQVADSIMIMYTGKQVERAPTETIVKNPLHPYTKLLISSLPEVGIKYSQAPLKGIPGRPPELLNPPEGCRFKVGKRKLTAVDNVSFSIGEGKIISLIGESGSGKTTIGKMMLKLIPITKGQILFQGKDLSLFKGEKLKEYYRYVQGVFQDPFSSFNPIFKADRIFELVKSEFFPELTGREWQFPHQLSGGQLQRMLIARALLLDTKFLVADEIISMLDASTRIDVLNILAELKKGGLSILFITHDLSLGYYISDESIILYRGSVMEAGKTEKVFSTPLHPYTRMLLDAVPRIDRKWTTFETPERKAVGSDTIGMCKYYDRCPLATKECEAQGLIKVEEDHHVACWRWNDV